MQDFATNINPFDNLQQQCHPATRPLVLTRVDDQTVPAALTTGVRTYRAHQPSPLLLYVGADVALPVNREHRPPPRCLHLDRRNIDQIERHGVRRRPVRPVAPGDAEAHLRGRRPLPRRLPTGRRDLPHVAPEVRRTIGAARGDLIGGVAQRGGRVRRGERLLVPEAISGSTSMRSAPTPPPSTTA